MDELLETVDEFLGKKIDSDNELLKYIKKYYYLLDTLNNIKTVSLTKDDSGKFGIIINKENNKIIITINTILKNANPDLKSKKKGQLIMVNGESVLKKRFDDVIEIIVNSGNTVDLDISLDTAGLTREEIDERLKEIEENVDSELSSNNIYTEDDLSELEKDTDKLNLLIELLEQYSRDVRESYDNINQLHFFNFEDLKEGLEYKICGFKKAGDRNKTECSEKTADSEKDLKLIFRESINQLRNFKVFVESKKKYEKSASANNNSNSPKRPPRRPQLINENLSLTSYNSNTYTSGERKSSVRKIGKPGFNKNKNKNKNKKKTKKKK